MPLDLSNPDNLLNNGIWYVDGVWVCPDASLDLSRSLGGANKVRAAMNYTSLSELEANRAVLTPDEYALVYSTINRINQHPQRFARAGQRYSENAGIMLMSRHIQRGAFCMCSIAGRRCSLWRRCPYCCHFKRMTILRKYLPMFHHGRWFYITLSWVRSLWVESPLVERMDLYWSACDFAVRHLIDSGHIKGAFVYEALHVDSYVPEQRALPHDHLVVLADELTPKIIQTFKDAVKSYTGQKWNSKKKKWEQLSEPDHIKVEPSTRSYPIPTQSDFSNILSYLVVPVNFAEKYLEAWPAASASGRAGVPLLNQNAIDLIDGCDKLSAGRDGHYYRGALHHSSGDFHGVKRSVRETREHEQMVLALLRDCADDNVAAFPFSDKTPIEQGGCSSRE